MASHALGLPGVDSYADRGPYPVHFSSESDEMKLDELSDLNAV